MASAVDIPKGLRAPLSSEQLAGSVHALRESYKPLILGPFDPQRYLGKKGILKTGAVGQKQMESFRLKYDEEFNVYLAKKINHLHRVYLNSYEGGDLQSGGLCKRHVKVLGSETIRDKFVAKAEQRNFGLLNRHEVGCILNDDKWDLVVNDSAILGAIHAGQDFMVWSEMQDPETGRLKPMVDGQGRPSIDRAILWHDGHNRLRVTGRELAMLKEAGYAPLEHDHQQALGIHFVNIEPEKARAMTLDTVCKRIEAIRERDLYAFIDSKVPLAAYQKMTRPAKTVDDGKGC